MSRAIDNLLKAQQRAMKIRPKVGGFPYLAEVLRSEGVSSNIWSLPSCQSLYITRDGPVIHQGVPLVTGPVDVPQFNQEALIFAIRKDQSAEGNFPEFLKGVWGAGVIRYDVDFTKRMVTYRGCMGEEYVEMYPEVNIPPSS